MRCERPSDIHLTLDNVLKQPDGKPYLEGVKDFSRPHNLPG
jgi:hypothetical protein